MKTTICTITGVVGAIIARLYGGWDAALTTLVMFMCIDYITGFIVAAVFKCSKKTLHGALESKAGFIGLCKKAVIMLIVLMACRLDIVMGSTFIKDATVIAFITNETISIIENAALMGIPIPKPIMQAIDILRKKGDEAEDLPVEDVESVDLAEGEPAELPVEEDAEAEPTESEIWVKELGAEAVIYKPIDVTKPISEAEGGGDND